MIFKRESVEATFDLDDKTELRCVAKNIEQAKKMAEEYSGKQLVLIARKIVLGRKDRGTTFIVNKPCFSKERTVRKQKK